MAWITPKTDWVATDFFNITDYNRVKNNLLHLTGMAGTLYFDAEFDGVILPDAVYTDRPSAYKLNQLELRLASIARVVGMDYGEGVTFYDFGLSIRYDELNRIESATLEMYQLLKNQLSALPMLSFTLSLQAHTPFKF